MTEDKLTIKAWAEDDRPREKLLLKGKQALSDAELLAILIRNGNSGETAVDLAKKILGGVSNDLVVLSKLTVNDLARHKGMGKAKAAGIVAALELGRRRREAEAVQRKKISHSSEAAELMAPFLADLRHEEFWVLFLNRANHIIARHQVSIGGVTGTVADSKIIFKLALENLASSVILCHNHPSGNLQPSETDKQLTKRLLEAGKLLEVAVLDHLIISDNGYFSFADEGLL